MGRGGEGSRILIGGAGEPCEERGCGGKGQLQATRTENGAQVPRPPPLDAKVPLGSRTCLSQAGTRSEWDLRYRLRLTFQRTCRAPRTIGSASFFFMEAVAVQEDRTLNALLFCETLSVW